MDLISRVLSDYANLKSMRGTFENQWQQVADYGLGRREITTEYATPGRPRQTVIFDATFQHSADSLAAALQSLLVNAAARWFNLAPQDRTLLNDPAVAEWFDLVTDETYRMFNDQEAAFATNMHETLLDIVAFGTGTLHADIDDNGQLFFCSRPLREIYVRENVRGGVDTIFRRFHMTAQQAYEMWGESAGPGVQAAFLGGKLDQRFEFCHAVLPRHVTQSYKLDPRSLPFQSLYINVTDKVMISESGYEELPYMVARWSKDAGELYGRGPGFNALADTKMLNRMSRTMLVAAEKATDPPIIVSDDGVISPIRTQPNGINIVRNTSGRSEPIRYLESGQRMDITQERYQSVREQVRGHFYHELLQTFDDPRMTATQVLELASRTAQRIGPMIFRLQSELLEPTVERVVGLGLRHGYYPDPPESIAGMELEIEYVSPAAQAQLNADVQSTMGLVGAAMEWSQLNPDVLDKVDFDKALDELGKAFGNAQKILRPQREVDQIRVVRNEESEQQQQLAMMEQVAGAAGKAAPALQMVQGGAA